MSEFQNLNIISGEQKINKAELITMIENVSFEAVERNTVYNCVKKLRLKIAVVNEKIVFA